MKKSTNILLGLGAIALMAFAPAATTTLNVKPAASNIEWYAEKVTGSHYGDIQLKEGTIELEGDQITGGEFVVDMTTINTQDLEGGSKKKLDGHLKSDDFFGVEAHPTAKFVITEVSPLKGVEGFTHTITGDLTIKGNTHSNSFPAKVKIDGEKLAAYGEMTVDRAKYDVRYGSTSFFDSLGDKAIMDDFTLKVSIGAKL